MIRAAWMTGEEISESMDFAVEVKFFWVIGRRRKKFILNHAFSR